MKTYVLPLLLALLLAGCASSRTATETLPPVAETPPATEPTTEPADAPTTEPVVEPDEAVMTISGNWWLLDQDADAVIGTGATRAYTTLLAGRQPQDTIVVAVIDSGIDVEHEDLDDVIWVNPGEIAGNGIDDDENGYVDDVHGWNFIGGPNGENVDEDTFEVTRLYARLHPKYGSLSASDVAPGDQAEYEEYLRVREAYQEKRQEYTSIYEQTAQIDDAVQQFVALLQSHLGTDSLTVEAVSGIDATSQQLQQAQYVYLSFAQQGFMPEDIHRERETLEGLVEYSLNPDFDPRAIVGDDYSDPTERYYGNNDVIGPDASHGTHVAGIIGAERNNGIGVDGIAPAVRIMVIRAVPNGDERDKDVANAIRYAVENGADIVNMSFGKAFSPQKEVVDEAVRLAMEQDVLLIHAAGNDSHNLADEPSFPTRTYADGGSADLWIEVGASTPAADETLPATFSNYGQEQVDVFAPGVQILSTIPGNGYAEKQGTSMAAPVVSGLAALLMAYYPDLTASQVKDIILRSAVPFAELQVIRPGEDAPGARFGELSITGAVINAPRALEMAASLAN